MKTIVEYTGINDRPLQKAAPPREIKALPDSGSHDGVHPSNLPKQHFAYYMPDDSDAARIVYGAFGLTLPT